MRVTNGTVFVGKGDSLQNVHIYGSRVVLDLEEAQNPVADVVGALLRMGVELHNTTIQDCNVCTNGWLGAAVAEVVMREASK